MTLVDSNVLIDIISKDSNWWAWSAGRLDRCASEGPLYFDEIIYSEVAAKSENEAILDEGLRLIGTEFNAIPKSALFLAAKIFGAYRAAGGIRASNLPDFFIGAHAQVARLPLLTRDVGRYRTYFPQVELIAPET